MSHDQDPMTSPENAEAQAPPAEDRSDTETAQVEESHFRDKYLLELAEKENMRKRLLREQGEMVRLAGEKSAIELLAPLDQFEKALEFAKSMSDEIKHWAVGFEMICEQFRGWLAAQGIHPYRSEGEMFSPHLHEAIERIVDNDRPAGLILREFTRGYRGRTRVLRPAKVAVCAHETTPTASTNPDDSPLETPTISPTDNAIPGENHAEKEK